MAYRNKRLLRSAEGQACVNCGAVGTTIAAHVRSVELVSGTGIKAQDYYTAHVCQRCHELIDGRTGKLSGAFQREMWTRCFLKTVARWFDQGIVIVKGDQ